MAIFGLILLVFFGWLAWQIVVFLAAAAVTAMFVVIMVVFGLGVVLTDPTLAHSPAAVTFIITVGVVVLVIWNALRDDTSRKPRLDASRGPTQYDPEGK